MAQFHSHVSDKSDHYASTTATHICIFLQFLFAKVLIDLLLTTMWYHMDGFEKQYRFAYAIYLLTCIVLEFYIIIDRSVGEP